MNNLEKLLEKSKEIREKAKNGTINQQAANWVLKDKVTDLKDQIIRELYETLKEFCDFDNPHEIKYISTPKKEYMKKARESLEKIDKLAEEALE